MDSSNLVGLTCFRSSWLNVVCCTWGCCNSHRCHMNQTPVFELDHWILSRYFRIFLGILWIRCAHKFELKQGFRCRFSFRYIYIDTYIILQRFVLVASFRDRSSQVHAFRPHPARGILSRNHPAGPNSSCFGWVLGRSFRVPSHHFWQILGPRDIADPCGLRWTFHSIFIYMLGMIPIKFTRDAFTNGFPIPQ